MSRLVTALLCLLLAACAAPPRLQQVRDFTDEAPKLAGFADLSQRFRDTYQRERPYLSAEAAVREQPADRKRHEAYPDFIALHTAAMCYLRALRQLADAGQFDADAQVHELAGSIKAWPDTGLSDRHVAAYASLVRVLTRAAGARQQDQALQAMLREGYQPLQDTLDAMQTLLRYYDKSHDNEQHIVLGLLQMEIAFASTPRERLLSALAKAHEQEKVAEYRLLGLRHTLASNHVAELRARHAALYRDLDPIALPLSGAQP
jgi:hypothetical protein